jgi:hypothetical protein
MEAGSRARGRKRKVSDCRKDGVKPLNKAVQRASSLRGKANGGAER